MSTAHRAKSGSRTRRPRSRTSKRDAASKKPKSRDKGKLNDLTPSAPPNTRDKLRKAAALFLDPAFQAFASLSTSGQVPSQTTPDAMLAELNDLARIAAQGDLSRPEKITLTHATILDVMFSRLTGLAFANAQGANFDSLLRLAFRAQAQCARTLEILATLKHPAVIARQLNVAHQQIVSGAGLPGPSLPPPQAVLPNSETIVRSAENRFSQSAHEAAILR